MKKRNYYVGQGFDVHRFAKKGDKPLLLAGVTIPVALSLDAVSDGDVVLHAISDAICGACGLGDIGDFFPPSAPQSQDIDSCEIVKFILNKVKHKFTIINLDITIIAEKPKLVTYKQAMTESIKKLFYCSKVNIKIKSKEGLNILGGIGAIACMVIGLVEDKAPKNIKKGYAKNI